MAVVTAAFAVTYFACLTICQAYASSAFFSSFVVPIFYDAVKLNELDIKNMPRGVPVKMQLQMLHSVTEFSYYLRPAQMMEFPVITIGANASHYKSIYRSNCHFDAWRLGEAELSPGFLGVCGGVVEGVIPINSSHVCQVRSTGQVLKSRTGISESISVHSVQIFPADVGVETVREMTGMYAKMEKEMGAADVHHPTFWRRLKLLKTRVRRSREKIVKLDFAFPVVTKTGPFVLKMAFVIDSGTIERLKVYEYSPAEYIGTLIGVANGLYRILDIKIVPVAVYVHEFVHTIDGTEFNFARPEQTGRKTLKMLGKYFEKVKSNVEFDCVHLLNGRSSYDGAIGLAYTNAICKGSRCRGLTVIRNPKHVTLISSTMAHEIAHNLGAKHVSKANCSCRSGECLMSTHGSHHTLLSTYTWSQCTLNRLKTFLDSGFRHCLKLSRQMKQKSFHWKIAVVHRGPEQFCGNGIVEGDEECDCGSAIVCGSDPCCDAEKCKLKLGAKCAHGTCCDKVTCQPKLAKTLCRDLTNECDLPEFCDGKSVNCPADSHMANGESCSENNFCFNGECGSTNQLCRALFGFGSQLQLPAHCSSGRPFTCTKAVAGSKTNWKALPGNCRPNYRQRSVFCTHYRNLPGLDLQPNGAACATHGGMTGMCVNGRCNRVTAKSTTVCNNNGWLNSLGNCHCKSGWSPPDCTKPGDGGSVNSGPSDPNWNASDTLNLDSNLLELSGTPFSIWNFVNGWSLAMALTVASLLLVLLFVTHFCVGKSKSEEKEILRKTLKLKSDQS